MKIAAAFRVKTFALAAGTLLAALALGGLMPTTAARADATTYSTARREFKVGMLLIDSTTVLGRAGRGPENPDPFVFYFADSRTDVKPANWVFVNPLAPKTVTANVFNRWSNPDPDPDKQGRDPGHPYTPGQTVTKNMAAYWEVSLTDASLDELLQFDLLFITNHRDTVFTPADREKMRKLVDAGGIVWIEDCGGMRISDNGRGRFFLDELQFDESGAGNGRPIVNFPNHPILNTPYRLTLQEVANLGDKNYNNYHLASIGANGATEQRSPNPSVLLNIVGNTGGNNLPYIAAGNYGSGAVVATSSDSGCDINDYAGGTNVGSGGNSGAFCGADLETAHAEDLKFVYNLVAWGSANNTDRRNGRRTGSSFEAVGAPLLGRFDFAATGTPANSIVDSRSSPLLVKTVLFVSGLVNGVPTLRAYDTEPFRDLDQDGNPDDGLPDLIQGAPYDEIWRVNLGGASGLTQPSAPTYAAVQLADNTIDERVYVTLPNGQLTAYRAFPLTNNRLDYNNPVLGGFPQGEAGGGTYPPVLAGNLATAVAPAPAFAEGRVHITNPDGLTQCVDAVTGDELWRVFDVAPTSTIKPVGSPVIGYSRLIGQTSIPGNGQGNTLDLMLYLPVQELDPSGNTVGRILPYWLGTRNEVLISQSGGIFATRVAMSGNKYYIARGGPGGQDGAAFIQPRARIFRAEYDNSVPPRVVVSARENYDKGNEEPLNSALYNAPVFLIGTTPGAAGYDGRVQVTRKDGQPLRGDEVLLALDYDLLYFSRNLPKPIGLNGNGSRDASPLLRTAGILNGDAILTPAALSPDDLLVYSALETSPNAGGPSVASIYATNEQPGSASNTLGNTKVRWRFTLHEGYGLSATSPVLVSGQQIADPPVLQNVLQFAPKWPGDSQAIIQPAPEGLTEAQPVGAPITTNNGITWVLARALSAYNPDANNRPGPVSVLMAFRTNQEITLDFGAPLDQVRAPVVAQVDPLSVSAAGANTVNLLPNIQYTVDSASGRIRINNFQSPGGNNAASASQSFVVAATPLGGSGTITKIFRPNDTNNPFTPLLYYYVLPGLPLSSPTLIGDHIYFTSDRGRTPTEDSTTAVMAVNADPRSIDPAVRTNGQQIINVASATGTAKIPTNLHFRWAGSMTGLNGAAIKQFTTGAPVGGQGTLAVNTQGGTFGFEDAVTLIADGKRVLEARPDGSVIWTLDATLKTTVAGGELPRYDREGALLNQGVATGKQVIERVPISRPQMVRRLSPSDMLIADTGNNRVVRVDRAGQVLWELNAIRDPYGLFSSGDPEALNSPTDVQLYFAATKDAGGAFTGGYEAHYLVADAGNFRLIEVADYFDRNGRPVDAPGTTGTAGQHVLIWTTRTTSKEGRRLRFQSVERFLSKDPRDPSGNTNGYPLVVAVVGNQSAAGADASTQTDFTGGALVQVDYQPYNTAFALTNNNGDVVANVPLWPYNANPRDSEPPTNGLIQSAVDDLVDFERDNSGATVLRIQRPQFFEQLTLSENSPAGLPGTPLVPNGQRRVYLLCDGESVFEIEPRRVGTRVVRYITWSFRQNNYDAINAQRLAGAAAALPRFLPTSVQRLASGSYLITNSFTGSSALFDNGRFLGEVFQVKKNDKSFDQFSIPKINNTAPYRQQMGDNDNSTLTEQPRFSNRLP